MKSRRENTRGRENSQELRFNKSDDSFCFKILIIRRSIGENDRVALASSSTDIVVVTITSASKCNKILHYYLQNQGDLHLNILTINLCLSNDEF